MRPVTISLVAAVSILVGCASDRQGEVLIAPAADWTSTRITPTVDHRFCGDEDIAADSLCVLGPIQLATVTRTGKVIATDARRLVALEPGAVAKAVARQGDGPGEIRAPFALRVDSLARLHVFDIRRMRYLVLGDTGTLADVGALPPRTMVGIRLGESGVYVLAVPAAENEGDSVTAVVMRRGSGDTTWADTVAQFPERAVFKRGAEGMFPPSLPWDRKLLWAVCGTGDVVVASTDVWHITRYRRAGAPVVSVRAAVSSRQVTAAERDSLLTARMGGASPPTYRAALADRMARSTGQHPVIDALHCDDAGEMYVRNVPDPGASTTTWDVVGANGQRRALLVLPARLNVLEVRTGRIVGVEETAMGAERIITMRIPGSD